MVAIKERQALSAIVGLILLTASLVACSSSPAEQHYSLQGEIVAIGPTKKLLTIQHGDIPNFMPAMTMSYTVAVPKEADDLKVGDKVSADLVVSDGRARLEKIVRVDPKADSAPGNPERK